MHVLNSRNNLSSMFVFTLHQDYRGYMWAGTYDGLNLLNGNTIKNFNIGYNGINQISGNLIERVQEDKNGNIWIHSNLGFDRYDTRKGVIEYHQDINGTYKSVVSTAGKVIVLKNNDLFYYICKSRKFVRLSFKNLDFDDILNITLDDNNVLTIICKNYVLYMNVEEYGNNNIQIKTISKKKMYYPIKWVGTDGSNVYVLTENNIVLRGDLHFSNLSYIYKFSPMLVQRGNVSTIIHDGNDILIGFYAGGAVRLKYQPMSLQKYIEQPFNIKCGVFDIKKDRNQDIIWFATDGEGVVYYTQEPYMLHNEMLNTLPFDISKPTRTILKDQRGNLWVGTKGAGLLQYPAYNPFNGSNKKAILFTKRNSLLLSNSIYSLISSQRNIIWIGNEGNSLNYFSFISGKIEALKLPQGKIVSNIHDMVEVNKNELWAASGSMGVYCIKLGGSDEKPIALDVKQILFNKKMPGKSQFVSINRQDHYLWIANRENGVYRYDLQTHKLSLYRFSRNLRSPLNDILELNTHIEGKLICGTANGLIGLNTNDKYHRFDYLTRQRNMSFGSIRSVIHTEGKTIWAATSHGLLTYNDGDHSSDFYPIGDNNLIMEYSDGAAYYDQETGIKYFGGTNGFIAISHKKGIQKIYKPDLIFQTINVDNTEIDINRLMNDEDILILPHNKNFFTITYNALDYLMGSSYTYQYRIKDSTNDWLDNGHNHEVVFSDLNPGDYVLQMRYDNGKQKSRIYEIKIRILPQWWASLPAKFFYWIIILTICCLIIIYLRKRQKRRQKEMRNRWEKRKKEDVYESKLRFFTSIAREFCTPLTMINGPCQRILSYKNSDSSIKKYAGIIQRNSLKLNELIQELIELRHIDSEDRIMHIEEVNIISEAKRISKAFVHIAQSHHIRYLQDMEDIRSWNTERNAFETIMTNLIDNAFRHTPDSGEVNIKVWTDRDNLKVTVKNSGPGIAPERLSRMFNHYDVVENVEQHAQQRIELHNEMGLAICEGLIKLLGGDINIESIPDQYTTFSVSLPKREKSPKFTEDIQPFQMRYKPVNTNLAQHTNNGNITIDIRKETIVVIDNNQEWLWFINDYLQEEFNIMTFSNIEKAFRTIQQVRPELVITNLKMNPFDGVQLCEEIRKDPTVKHISLIIVSSITDEQTRIRCMDAGADTYITKPFDMVYLHAVILRHMHRNHTMKDYYKSSMDAFEVIEGKILHKDDKMVIQKITGIIKDNITNPDLSTSFIADKMGLSVRNLYRKLQSVTDEKPVTIIKNMRIERARWLLANTELSMEEISFKSGFANKSTFYKHFFKQFNYTPKQYHEKLFNNAKEAFEKHQ